MNELFSFFERNWLEERKKIIKLFVTQLNSFMDMLPEHFVWRHANVFVLLTGKS
jgi:hypothetical protein